MVYCIHFCGGPAGSYVVTSKVRKNYGKKVWKLLEEADATWQVLGFSEKVIGTHLKKCVEEIEQLDVSKLSKDEMLVKCKQIIKAEEKIMTTNPVYQNEASSEYKKLEREEREQLIRTMNSRIPSSKEIHARNADNSHYPHVTSAEIYEVYDKPSKESSNLWSDSSFCGSSSSSESSSSSSDSSGDY